MRQMQPVLWTKGVMLTPQHLQMQDRFLEGLIDGRLHALSAAPWGFSRLKVDREMLAGGAFGLAAAAGIFPDGLLFDIPGADAPPPPRTLEGCWDADQETLDIYLTIPEYREGDTNVSIDGGTRIRTTRYLADVVLRRDENTGLAEKPLQVARKNFRLLVQGEALEGSAILRTARLRRTAGGEVQVDETFVPSLLDVTASEYLLGITRRLVERLAAKSGALAATRRQRNQSLADFSLTDVANFWLLYTVNAHFPRFRHILDVRRGHPVELYEAMLALGGALTTFSATIHPSGLPAYDHDELSRCFSRLDATVQELLDTVVPANYVSLPLRQVQPSVYATALDDERYLTATQCFLAIHADIARPALLKGVPGLVKVTSADQIDRLIRQALAGATLTHSPNPPSAVPVKADYEYFQVRRSGEAWDAVRRARNLAAYVPGEIPAPKLELVLVLETPAR